MSTSQMIQFDTIGMNAFDIFSPLFLCYQRPAPSTWKSPVLLIQHLISGEIMLFAIKLGNVWKWYEGRQQAKKEAMNIFQALSDVALSSKREFIRRV